MKYTHEHAFLTSKYHNKLHYITKECKQMGAILVVMGNGLWLPHQDRQSSNFISLANKIQPSPGVLE